VLGVFQVKRRPVCPRGVAGLWSDGTPRCAVFHVKQRPRCCEGAGRHTCAVPPVARCVAAGFVAGCARRHVTPSVSTKRPAQATDAVRVRSVRAEGCVGAAKVAPLDQIRCAEMREPVDRAVGRHGEPTAQCVQLRAAAFRVDGRHPCPCMASLASVARGLPPFHVKQAPVSRRGSEAAARGRSVRRSTCGIRLCGVSRGPDRQALGWRAGDPSLRRLPQAIGGFAGPVCSPTPVGADRRTAAWSGGDRTGAAGVCPVMAARVVATGLQATSPACWVRCVRVRGRLAGVSSASPHGMWVDRVGAATRAA
jgi:hypothetical protein